MCNQNKFPTKCKMPIGDSWTFQSLAANELFAPKNRLRHNWRPEAMYALCANVSIFSAGSNGCRRAEVKSKPFNLAKSLPASCVQPKILLAQHNSYSYSTYYTHSIVQIYMGYVSFCFVRFQETPLQAMAKTSIPSDTPLACQISLHRWFSMSMGSFLIHAWF